MSSPDRGAWTGSATEEASQSGSAGVRAGGFSFGGVGAPGRWRPEAGPGTQHASGCRECGAGSVPGTPAAA